MIWLLRIEIAGRTWFLSSRACEPEQAGVEIPHHGSLTVEGFGEGLEIGGGVSGPCSASVRFHHGPDGWPYFLDGHRMDGADAEVSLWRPGTTYAARVVLLRGQVDTGGAVPIDGQDLEAKISAPLIQRVTAWPPADDVLTVEAWPNLPSDDDTWDLVGEPYPWPLGALGAFTDEDGTAKTASTTRVLCVDPTLGAEIGVVAGGPVSASTIVIWNSVHKDRATFAVTTTTDGTGIARATVSFAAAPAAWTFDGSEDLYVVDWGAGGLVGDTSSGTTTALGDAIVFMLSRRYGDQGQDRIDYGTWAALAGTLSAWEVGIAVESGDPLDVITSDLMALCPALWIVGGPGGYRPVVLSATAPGLCRPLTVGRDLFQTDEPPVFASIDPVNTVALTFAPATYAGKNRGVVATGRETSPLALASWTRHDVRAVEVEAKATFDRGTAALSGEERTRIGWTPALVLTYDAPADVALTLDLGERYVLTDADRDIDGRAVWLLARETDDGETWRVSLIGIW